MTVPIPVGGSRLEALLGDLVNALAAIDPTPYQQNDAATFHEAVIYGTDAAEEPDDSAHLAFALVAIDTPPALSDRLAPGHAAEWSTRCSLTLSYRLRDGAEGNADGRAVHSALLDLVRVIASTNGPTQAWTSDTTVNVGECTRGRLVAREGAWVRYQILFTLQYVEEL